MSIGADGSGIRGITAQPPTKPPGAQPASGGSAGRRSVHGSGWIAHSASKPSSPSARVIGSEQSPCGGIITRSTDSARPVLEARDARERLRRGGARGLAGRSSREQLALDVVVAVEDDARAGPPGARKSATVGRVRAARVERDHRHRRVVGVLVGVLDQPP